MFPVLGGDYFNRVLTDELYIHLGRQDTEDSEKGIREEAESIYDSIFGGDSATSLTAASSHILLALAMFKLFLY